MALAARPILGFSIPRCRSLFRFILRGSNFSRSNQGLWRFSTTLKSRSNPPTLRNIRSRKRGALVFAYTITLVNRGSVSAQLLSRHWVITDADSQVEEVRGDGVVGEQPVLKPGEGFRYTSGAVIETPVGTMQGSYQMVAADGQQFDAAIPEFVLSAPRTLH